MADKKRMVELKTFVLPYPRPRDQSLFQFDNILNHKLPDIIGDYSDGKPVLIFCITRKSTMQLARFLVDSTKFNLDTTVMQQLVTISQKISDSTLRTCVIQGVGYHHAGLNQDDRQIIENTFTAGILPILCSTSTLAMGVNLPAHLVIIKGTRNFNFTSEHIYTQNSLLQMIGRAGRPQFDTSATAVILTSISDESEINKMLRVTSEMIESHLHIHLTEHLNTEISLNTIENISDIEAWIKNTLLYIRCRKNPIRYGFSKNILSDMVDQNLIDLVIVQLKRLCDSQLVQYRQETGKIYSTDTGHLMSRYFMNIETMEKIGNLSSTHSIDSLIEVLSNCAELSDLNLRYSERTALNNLNRQRGPNKIRFPIKGRIISTPAKINCLIQVVLGSQQIKDSSLVQDADRIFRIGNRILRCTHDYLFLLSNQSDNYVTLLNCTLLKKCFNVKMWDNTWFISQQLPGIGSLLASYLTDVGLNTLNKVANADPKLIDQVLRRHPPFGQNVVSSACGFPKYELNVEQVGEINCDFCDLKISVRRMRQRSDDDNDDCDEQFAKDCVILLLADKENNVLLKTRITHHQVCAGQIFKKDLHIDKACGGPDLTVDLLSEYYVGFDIRTQFRPSYARSKVNTLDDKVPNIIEEKPFRNPSVKGASKDRQICQFLENEVTPVNKSTTTNIVKRGDNIMQLNSEYLPQNICQDVVTPAAKRPKTFSWKTCEIYKQSVLDSSFSTQSSCRKLERVVGQEILNKKNTCLSIFKEESSQDNYQLDEQVPKKEIMPSTVLSYGREHQTNDSDEEQGHDSRWNSSTHCALQRTNAADPRQLVSVDLDATIRSDDSFNDEMSRAEFDIDDDVKERDPNTTGAGLIMSHCTESAEVLLDRRMCMMSTPVGYGTSMAPKTVSYLESTVSLQPSLSGNVYKNRLIKGKITPKRTHTLSALCGDDITNKIRITEIESNYKSSYYERGWEDLFDFIKQMELIKASKNLSSIRMEE